MYKNWSELKQDAIKKISKYDKEYQDRLEFELKEIDKQGANDYWLDIINSDDKYDTNKNGLVLPYIFNVTNIDPIKGQKKLYINGDESIIDGIEITLENGTVINASSNTLIKTKRGFIHAKHLSENDEL